MVDAKMVAELRAKTGGGIVDCKKALEENGGDMEKAAEWLRKKGVLKAGSKAERVAKEGLIYAYVHGNGKAGAMVEMACETDFVARTDGFKELCHEMALQIVAMNPLYISKENVPAEVLEKEKEIYASEFAGGNKPAEMVAKIVEGKLGKYYAETCLMNQSYIKDEDKTIEDVIKEAIAKTGENIQVRRFSRFSMESNTQVPG